MSMAMGGGGLDPAALQNLPPEVRANILKQLAQQQQAQQAMGGAHAGH